MIKSEKVIKELRDFNHNEAADYIEFLLYQLAGISADLPEAQADAWDEGFNSSLGHPDEDPEGYINPYRTKE